MKKVIFLILVMACVLSSSAWIQYDSEVPQYYIDPMPVHPFVYPLQWIPDSLTTEWMSGKPWELNPLLSGAAKKEIGIARISKCGKSAYPPPIAMTRPIIDITTGMTVFFVA